MTEFELKFQLPPDRAAAVEAALRRGDARRTRLRARYFDTADEALARNGLVLRLRQEGRAWVQTAKGGGAGFERLEHDVPAANGDAVPDIRLHEGHPVGQRLQAALAHATSGLRPVFETDIERLARTMEAAGSEVEIAFDRGRIRAGEREAPVLEVEFELKQGSPAAVAELAAAWCREHGLWLDPLTKSGAGWRLAKGIEDSPALKAAPIPKAGSPSALLAAILSSALRQVLANAREIAVGQGSDAHVHQLRVGIRRLRVAVRELGLLGEVAALAAETEPALKEVFRAAGLHRDGATLVPEIARQVAAAGGPALAWRPTLPDVGAAVRASAFQQALLRLIVFVQELLAVPDERGLKRARKAVARRIGLLHRKILRQGQRFAALEPERRHAERKRLKRLRYLCELTRPLFRGCDVDAYVASLEQLQDKLGEYQDAVAAGALLAAHAAQEPAAWFAEGWLAARGQVLAGACERACRRAARKAQPYWD